MIRKLRRLTIALAISAAILGLTVFTPNGTGTAVEATSADSEPALLQVPTPSGMTIGYAGTSQPQALAAAQPFTVRSLAVFDVPTQRWSTYVPGAPSFANTLNSTNLAPDSIVFAKRSDDDSLLWSPPAFAGPPVVAAPDGSNTLTPPPPDGLTIGAAGTTDPAALAAVQLFDVETINAWDVAKQRYNTYIPGAPAVVNTLTSRTLDASTFVWMKANGGPTGAILIEDTPLIARLVAPQNASTILSLGQTEFGEIIDMGDGRFTYIPLENYYGLDSFPYAYRSEDGPEERTFRLFVLPVNDAPEAIEDTALALPNIVTLIDVLENDIDGDGDDLSIIRTAQPKGGIVTVAGASLTYTPFAGFAGADTFTYEVSDGIAAPGESPESIGTVTVVVSGALANIPNFGGGGGIPIAGPPPADDDTGDPPPEDPPPAEFLTNDELYIETCVGEVTIDVLANDAGDGSTLTVASIGTPTLGTAANGGANVTYTPPEDCTGDDSFTYTVIDASEVEHTASVAVHLGQADPAAGDTGDDANQAPSAVDDAAITFETTPITIDLLANDSDPDDDAISITTVSDPDYGTVVDNGDGTVTYTAPDYYGGSVTFSYTITDGVSGDSTATVTVTVSRGAVSVREPIVVYAGSGVTVQVITPSDFVQLESVTEGSHGTVSMSQSNGTFTFQPHSDFIGSDWISYTLLFSHGGTAETTVQIDVVN